MNTPKFLIAAVIALITATASAQQRYNKEVVCRDTKEALDILLTDHGERPVWVGKTDSERNNYMMLVNVKTQTWSLLQLNQNAACLIGSGTGFDFTTKFVEKGKLL